MAESSSFWSAGNNPNNHTSIFSGNITNDLPSARKIITPPTDLALLYTLEDISEVNPHSVNWSPDGRWLACGDTNGTVRVWEANTGKLLHTLMAYTGKVHSLCAVVWSPNGNGWLPTLKAEQCEYGT